MTTAVGKAKRGDVVRFKAHAIQVQADPLVRGNRIQIHGRENRDGCPLVTRWYFCNLPVIIERGTGEA